MEDKKNIQYTSIPIEDPDNQNSSKLDTFACNTAHNPALQQRPCCRSKVWRKVLFGVLGLALAGRLILSGVYLLWSKQNVQPIFDIETSSPSLWDLPEWKPQCIPTIQWEGNTEHLLDPDDISGLLYKVTGIAQGKVIIRQDPWSNGYINITSRILISEQSLQNNVNVQADIIDDDFEMKINTPKFFPLSGCVSVVTEITLPLHVKYFRSLSVSVPNADIVVEELGDVDFAYVSLDSTNGRITIDDIRVASADISTINGHIHGGIEVSESLALKNVNGAIYARTRLNPWAEDVSITVNSANGQIDIHVCDINEQQTLDFYARNVNGGVVAAIDDTYKGDFSVSSMVGFVNVQGDDLEFEKNSRNSKAGFKGQKYSGKESHVEIEAVTGSVDLVFH